jgi:hypothetical protein
MLDHPTARGIEALQGLLGEVVHGCLTLFVGAPTTPELAYGTATARVSR